MKFIFEYDNVEQSNRLEAYTKEKLENLNKKYSFVTRADIFFKTENTSNDNKGMICNIRLSVPEPRLFAEASKENFTSSISESVNELEKQLRKKKEKMLTY